MIGSSSALFLEDNLSNKVREFLTSRKPAEVEGISWRLEFIGKTARFIPLMWEHTKALPSPVNVELPEAVVKIQIPPTLKASTLAEIGESGICGYIAGYFFSSDAEVVKRLISSSLVLGDR